MIQPKRDFVRQFSIGMGIVIACAAMTVLMGLVGMREVANGRDRLASVYAENALSTSKLLGTLERRSSLVREYFLTGDPRALRQANEEATAFAARFAELRARTPSSDGRALLDRIDEADARYAAAIREASTLREKGLDTELNAALSRDVLPRKGALDAVLNAFEARKEQQFDDAELASAAETRRLAVLGEAGGGLALVAVVVLALLLRRGVAELSRGRELIAQSLERVEKSNGDLNAFAGRVAHDLRDALGPVLLGTRMLRGDEPSSERAEALCRRLDRAVERALGLIDSLLAFARAGAPPDAHAAASIRSAVVDVLEALEPKTVQVDARIVSEIEDADVRCSAGILYILVLNLVSNAVKFVRDQRIREIRVRGQATKGGYELAVEDTGPGIPESARQRIFEAFYRVPGTKPSGTGIGLATVRRIIDAYGGRVAVESTEGRGTCFSIWLPLAKAGTDPDPVHPAAHAVRAV
jgi:signal transduction histidine kinase